MKRKQSLLFGLSTVSTLATIAYLQMAPMSTARAQTTDPGLNPDPTPRVEATPTPTPCPDPEVTVTTTKNAQWEWSCDNGGPIKTTVQGEFVKTTVDPCNGDKTEDLSSTWVVKAKRIVLAETIPPATEDDEPMEIYEAEYDLAEVRSDGEEIQTKSNMRSPMCCVN